MTVEFLQFARNRIGAPESMKPTSSLERILDVLLAFADRPDGVTMQDLSGLFALSRSTVYRYVQILKSRGMIEETPVPGLLRIGPSVRLLALARGARRGLTEIAQPILEELAAETGETILLTRRLADKVSVVASVDSPQLVSVRVDEARNSALHVGSFGKLHLAYLPADEMEVLLSEPMFAATTAERLDPDVLRTELTAIRRRGYALSESEVEMGMKSISAPILTDPDALLAVLTIAGPTFRLKRQKTEVLYGKLRRAADRIIDAWHDEAISPPSEQAGRGRL